MTASASRKKEVELVLETHLRELGLADFTRELEFSAPERHWRFDYAIERLMLAIEIEGGIFVGGRHTRGRGYQDDLDKYNAATSLGWRVFRFSVEDLLRGREIEPLKRLLGPTARRADQRPEVAAAESPKMASAVAGEPASERVRRLPSSFLAVARQFLT